MNKEEFGVNILSVQEIRGWEDVTPIPNAPDQIKGVMNLRGTVVPVIDLRMCFGLPKIDYSHETVVIILSITAEGVNARLQRFCHSLEMSLCLRRTRPPLAHNIACSTVNRASQPSQWFRSFSGGSYHEILGQTALCCSWYRVPQ